MRQLGLGAVAAHLPLALAIVSTRRRAHQFEYQADTLDGALVEQMLTHYIQLLDSALAEPGRRIASLDMLGAGERDVVLAQSHGELVAGPAVTMLAVLEAAASEKSGARTRSRWCPTMPG